MEGGPLTLVGLLLMAPLLLHRRRAQNWQLLVRVEQNLRRASHGFALVVFTIAAALLVYGADGVRDFFPWLLARPDQAWPGAVFVGGLLAVGMARFLAGVRRVAGFRDGLLQGQAFVKFAIGLTVTVYLGRLYPWRGATDLIAFAVPAVFAIASWCVLIGGVRFLLLTVGGSSAVARVIRHIQQTQIVMRPVRRRRWWKFW